MHRYVPEVGGVIRDITRSVVLLPEPFGPMMPRLSPRRTCSDTSSSATNGLRAPAMKRGRCNSIVLKSVACFWSESE